MKVLIIQENGRHDANRNYRECFCLQRAFQHHKIKADVWGLGHKNYSKEPRWNSYDLIINAENYDETSWVPNLKEVKAKKFLWSIDAHCKGILSYLNTFEDGKYDLILQATPEFILDGNSVWFPNAYDDTLIKPLDLPKTIDIGFCGNVNNREGWINMLSMYVQSFKFDEMVLGDDMVKAINTYKVHFNANISIDINYRNFETIGCGTCLMTNPNPYYDKLGFKDGVNCMIYNDGEELLKKAFQVIRDDNKRLEMEKNAIKLAEKHTYKERVNIIKELMK